MVEEARPLGIAGAERFLSLCRGWIARAAWGSTPLRDATIAADRRLARGFAVALGALLLGAAFLAAAAQPVKKNPSWSELTPEQQQILAPLAGEWDKLEPVRKKKWLGVAKRYPKMTPIGQKRTQTRMKKWVKLSPEERREAREKYRRITKLPPEQRKDLSKRWAEYQSLPPSERQKVAPPSGGPRAAKRKQARAAGPSETTADSRPEW